MERISSAQIRELCRVKKGIDERIDGSILRCFDHVEKMEKDKISIRVYVGECDGNHSVYRPQKRWTDTMKEYLKKRGLDIR